ncbi:MAG TPA: type II secretion system F family protein [Candidatus Gastranaerophilaceae bacterium]|nr:type II secretion system F family protein [Candidatus Gastranaerophilaceae bacterium]HPT41354.1 type II secretion system F family protein [Candidatus Gastranaerophilaceae bacterium]
MIFLILSLIIGISAAIFVWAIFVIEKDLSPNTLKRLTRIKQKTNIIEDDEEEFNLLKVSEYKIQQIGEFLQNFKISNKIKELIALSGVNLYIDTFIFISLLCAAPFLLFILTPFKLMSLFGIVAIFLPTFYLKQTETKRFIEFSKQFPDALNLMASSLKAGHPLFSAIDTVVEEMPKPISDVFETVKKDLSLGIDTKEAFLSMTRIMPKSMDLRFFITAVLIQKEIGGNLAELLNSLSATIRERFKLIGQLRVQTAQSRLSGIILGIVPIAVLLIISFMNPEYMKPLFETKDGQMAFATAMALIVVGFISIKKASEIEF